MLKYAISNIAFSPAQKEEIYKLILNHGFSGLEIAPSLFLDGAKLPYEVEIEELAKQKKLANDAGLELVSMQSLLFGVQNLFLFESEKSRKDLLNYCKKAIDFAATLQIPNLVFGSPNNRIIPDSLSEKEANKIAVAFFKELGEYAYSKKTILAMEANSSKYGGNFITKTSQAISLIKEVNSPGFKLNLDMGTMSLENEENDIICEEIIPLINHIHICEGFLKPIYEGNHVIHKQRAKIIKNSSYDKYLSIEMKSADASDNVEHVKRALEFVEVNYINS